MTKSLTDSITPPPAQPGDVADDKLVDAVTPGFAPEFDPDEAESLGAFEETALTEADAIEASADLIEAVPQGAK